MNRVVAALTAIFISAQASAAEVWVTFSQLTSKEKLETLAEERRQQLKEADFISSFEVLTSHPVSKPVLASIFKLEQEAQSTSTNGEFKKSLSFYQSLRAKLETVPNVSGVERITFSVLVHLAELHDLLKDGEGPRAWRQVHAWDNRRLKPSTDFSPKVTEKFNALKLRPLTATLEIFTPSESAVYVDGQRVRLIEGQFRKDLELGSHHVDVLAPGSQWMSKSVELKNTTPQEMSFRPEPIVEGTCDAPHFIGDPLPPKTKLLVNFGDCDRIYYEKNWFTIAGRRLESLSPGRDVSNLANPLAMNTESAKTAELPILEEPGREKSWITETLHSKWLWIGAGVIAVGVAAMALQSQPTVTPTNTYK